MTLFPNREFAHPDDVFEYVKEEYRKQAGAGRPDAVEQASRDSFPASDAPPWTLGCTGPPARPDGNDLESEGDDAMNERTLTLSDVDHRRLEALIASARTDCRVREDYLTALEVELRRAHVVPADDVPADVVTMNSLVRVRDLDSDEAEVYELVYPADADMARGRISVLAPVGTALLGYRLGDVIEWPVPAGLRRLRVEEVMSQPGSACVLNR